MPSFPSLTRAWLATSSGARSAILALLLLAGVNEPAQAAEGAGTPPNQLTEAEKADGWKLLFDGQTTKGWRSFKKQTFPEKGWVVENGCLKHPLKAGGGDIMTEETFSEFDLSWEWSLVAGGNSGLKYFVRETRDRIIGHEYQLLEPPTSEPGKGATGGFYDVMAPTQVPATRPPPAFNHSRIRVKGNQVEHWLNGVKTLEYTLGSDAVKKAVAESKFKSVPGFGTCVKGHLLLQDHGGEISFRNVKIRDLSPAK